MRSVVIIALLLCSGTYSFSQTIQGFVINKDSRLRLARVYIFNLRSDVGVINNPKGEFSIPVQQGDVLFAALEGYAVDTIVFNGQNAIYFQLKPLAIQVRQVDIIGKRLNPMEAYLKQTRENKYKTDRGKTGDIFSIGPAGAGLNIDAIFSLLSREGRNARYLQKVLERDYKQSLIDFRFNPEIVARVLNIKDPELSDFMLQYRPTYTFILTASEYAFTAFIKNSYASYKRAPDAYRLPTLPKLMPD